MIPNRPSIWAEAGTSSPLTRLLTRGEQSAPTGTARPMMPRMCTTVRCAYAQLRTTGRGKHVGRFSYYHIRLIAHRPGVASYLETLCQGFCASFRFNVVKLGHKSRVSFLHYEDFSVPFPALLRSLSCDAERGTCRRTSYAERSNPPILHRKELLLHEDDPLVPDAERLTRWLELHGAFRDARAIGTREVWRGRLAALGLTEQAPR